MCQLHCLTEHMAENSLLNFETLLYLMSLEPGHIQYDNIVILCIKMGRQTTPQKNLQCTDLAVLLLW